ncbi:hypothetical protein LZ554_009586 [Drepanopeziza brunnea f. sp. 'monogermtubi']|nr:hypothetical protein LZ554_009586 [Drepanopeziza brunnea f. sp. 'monogermtubi']
MTSQISRQDHHLKMKCLVFISAFTTVASMAIAPSLNPEAIDVVRQMSHPYSTVEDHSTKSRWVTAYPPPEKKESEWDIIGHWLPSGPGFLDLETLNYGYHEHLIAMHESHSWVHASILAAKRFLGF